MHTAGVEWKAKWHVGDTPMVRTIVTYCIDSKYASNCGSCMKGTPCWCHVRLMSVYGMAMLLSEALP